MPNRPNRAGSYQKPKNFKDSIKKLFHNLKPYTFAIVIAIILVIISTVCTLIGPNRLSEVTDIIEEGVSFNIDLTGEQLSTLKSEKLVRLESEQATFLLQFEDYNNENTEDDTVTLSVVTSADGVESTIYIGSTNYQLLLDSGYVNFDNMQMGIGYSQGVLSI